MRHEQSVWLKRGIDRCEKTWTSRATERRSDLRVVRRDPARPGNRSPRIPCEGFGTAGHALIRSRRALERRSYLRRRIRAR
jgi:hypothetical protein